MNYKAHEFGGLVASVVGIIISIPFVSMVSKGDEFIIIITGAVIGLGGLIGSLLPDIDIPSSKISRSLGGFTKGISFLINKIFGHRGVTHKIWFIFFIDIILLPGFYIFWFYPINILYLGFLFGLSLGMLSHILLDS